MLKRHHRFFQTAQVVRDALLVGISFWIAYVLRFSLPELIPYGSISPRSETLWVGTTLVVLWPAVGWLSGLYVSRRLRGVGEELFDVAKVSVIAFMLLVTLTYFVRDERFSRGILLLGSVISVGMVGSARMLARGLLRALRSRGLNLRHVVVVGTGEMAARVARTLHNQASLGMRVVGFISADEGEPEGRLDAPVIGTVGELGRLVGPSRGIDQVIVALPIERLGVLREMMEVLSHEPVDVRVVPDFYQYATLCGSIDELAGMPVINLQDTPLIGWNLVAKRAFDVVASAVGLLLVSPLLALIAAAIRLEGRGPVLYLQERVGMDGRRFTMVKFRSMRADAEQGGAAMATPDDERRTRLGAWLRRLSLDELPQLWNVLRGDMSLVGPRPERPCFIDYFKREIPRYALRHKIKAGMTGWAQINGMRGNTSIAKRVELDLYYIEHWSLLLDVKILLRTLFGGFLSPNAY